MCYNFVYVIVGALVVPITLVICLAISSVVIRKRERKEILRLRRGLTSYENEDPFF